ncbi:MAG: hypothetical protein ACTHM4_10645, partial [Rhodanobacteraceae bacterium]
RDRQPTEPEKVTAGLRDLTDLPPSDFSCANVCHGDDSVKAGYPSRVVPMAALAGGLRGSYRDIGKIVSAVPA